MTEIIQAYQSKLTAEIGQKGFQSDEADSRSKIIFYGDLWKS